MFNACTLTNYIPNVYHLTVAVSNANSSLSTAVGNEDYEPIAETIHFSGESQEWVRVLGVKINNDNRVEAEESFVINFVSASNNLVIAPESRTITITIIDDDGKPDT